MLARLRKTREEGEGGFTLIELLVVVIIIGILAAIAIPVFLSQRKKAYDSSAQSDLRNVATAEESYLTNPGVAAYSTTGSDLTDNGFRPSGNVTTNVAVDAANYFCAVANNSKSDKWFLYDSKNGGLQSGTYTTAALAEAACSDTSVGTWAQVAP